MRGVTGPATVSAPAAAEEATQFAATVAAIASRHAQSDPWEPGAAASDANAALDEALREAGWDELGRDPALLPLAAPAGAALGRAFAPLAPIDALLGEPVCVDGLVRYGSANGELLEYTDALGIAGVTERPGPGGERTGRGASHPETAVRRAAWVAASTGYLAGLAEEALRLALEHARARRAFGGSLSALEPVQQMLADAATLVDGLTLLTGDCPGPDALAHAGDASERAVGICMQVTGALGFTMEFPLQRAYRRSRAARAWNDALVAAWDEPVS
jgi:3-oxo-4-pregnene-20-carboxyl-CoA dehydrogenase alpha subunit